MRMRRCRQHLGSVGSLEQSNPAVTLPRAIAKQHFHLRLGRFRHRGTITAGITRAPDVQLRALVQRSFQRGHVLPELSFLPLDLGGQGRVMNDELS